MMHPKLGDIVTVKSRSSDRIFKGKIEMIKSPTELLVFLFGPKYSEFYHPAECEVIK